MGFRGSLPVLIVVLLASGEVMGSAPDWMRTCSLEGRVHSEAGFVAGARIQLRLFMGSRFAPTNSVSDARGRYRVDRLPPGAYSITAMAPNRATRRVTLWILPGHNAARPMVLGPSALLGGRVLDDRGRPVERARVEVAPQRSNPSVASRATTDGDGRFVVQGLGAGACDVRVSATGHLDAAREDVMAPIRDLTLRLVRLYRVRGVVIPAAAGEARARVFIAGSGIWPGRWTAVQQDGTFTIERVPAGVYEVMATAERPPMASESIAGLAVGPLAPPPILLGLLPAQRVEGEVHDDQGPVAGALISIGRGILSAVRHRVVSDERGAFALGPLGHGEYQLGVWARGYLPQVAWTVQVPVALPMKIDLSRGASINATVTDTAGAPVVGASVRAVYRATHAVGPVGELGVLPGPVPPIPPAGVVARFGPSQGGASSAADGTFRLSGLQPGAVQLVLTHPDHAESRSQWITLRGDEARQIPTVVMKPGARLSGRVLDERGVGIHGATVTVSGDHECTSFTDAGGEYRFEGLEGRLLLEATHAGYLPRGRRLRLAGSHDRTVDLALDPARGLLSGFVVDPSRLPVTAARVVAVRGRHQIRGTTDPRGFFQFAGVGAGSLELRVRHPDYVLYSRQIDAGEDSRVELQLQFSASVAGRVEDGRAGVPVEAFELVARAPGKFQHRLQVHHRGGQFELRGVPPGPLQLEVRAAGYATGTTRVTVRQATRAGEVTMHDVVLVLTGAGSIAGRVSDLMGRAVGGARVESEGVVTRSAVDGSFLLTGVPEGVRRVWVIHGARRLQSDPVVVRAGEIGGPLRLELR